MKEKVLPLYLLALGFAGFAVYGYFFEPGDEAFEVIAFMSALIGGLWLFITVWRSSENKYSEVQREAADLRLLLLTLRSEAEVRYILGVFASAAQAAFEHQRQMYENQTSQSTLEQITALAEAENEAKRRKVGYWRLRRRIALMFPEKFALEPDEKYTKYLPGEIDRSNIYIRHKVVIDSM